MLQSKLDSIFDLGNAFLKNMLSEVPVLCYNCDYDLYFFYHKNEIYEYSAVFSHALLKTSNTPNDIVNIRLPKEISHFFNNIIWDNSLEKMEISEKLRFFRKKEAVECRLLLPYL